MNPKKDGCPRCLTRDNEAETWDEATGKATYQCTCGHAWSTHWEHAGAAKGPTLFGDGLDEVLAGLGIPPVHHRPDTTTTKEN